jgi:hypothetical protein
MFFFFFIEQVGVEWDFLFCMSILTCIPRHSLPKYTSRCLPRTLWGTPHPPIVHWRAMCTEIYTPSRADTTLTHNSSHSTSSSCTHSPHPPAPGDIGQSRTLQGCLDVVLSQGGPLVSGPQLLDLVSLQPPDTALKTSLRQCCQGLPGHLLRPSAEVRRDELDGGGRGLPRRLMQSSAEPH